MMMRGLQCAVAVAIVSVLKLVNGFSPQVQRSWGHHAIATTKSPPPQFASPTAMGMLPLADMDSLFLLADVPVFDGSSIVDPVVVSGAFWDGLSRQFVSLLIGQLLAATVFGVITTFAGSQISKLTGFLSDTVQSQVDNQQKGSLKQPPPEYQGEVTITPDLAKLAQCIAIDCIGTSSELIPLIGEVTDVLWAPIAALLLRSLYPGSKVVFLLEFTEEILPFTDILPLATICWVVDTLFPTSGVAKTLQLGIYGQNVNDGESNVMDPPTSYASSTTRQRERQRSDGTVIDVESQPVEGDKTRQLPPSNDR
ncbi:Inherit from COG: Phosphoglycerate mutase [Seminavis robusta]|uniref:Inherit from COG: Phosphoglycerate mutase n=1 Tax=Seminavis robusta TaxID=568900 RepID=A0A9N8H7L1_9STRA|nr:Inherit from COG: Phosphoglycerate mutase [Seminavis robusta]|eukprot:Sro132_g062700.1 Inherit from COG: Phosphoglycerate mutase (310) ;mRNA; r:78427-79631